MIGYVSTTQILQNVKVVYGVLTLCALDFIVLAEYTLMIRTEKDCHYEAPLQELVGDNE